jgi:hypothetical protein
MKFNPERHTLDENGQWWYTLGPSHRGWKNRTRVTPKECAWCKEMFVPTVHSSKCCGKVCGQRYEFAVNPERARGRNAPRWGTGKSINRNGYVTVHCPDHPMLKNTTRKYVLEHRLVMEAHLGRILGPKEYVHHKNGVKDDNRIENLELWQTAQPPGQRDHQIKHCPTCTCNEH